MRYLHQSNGKGEYDNEAYRSILTEFGIVEVCPITVPLRVFTQAEREREREKFDKMIISLKFVGITQT